MDLTKDIYSSCFDPKKITVYNGITKRYEEIFVPCGKCYHCLITKVNEWVTRMQLQTLYSKYCYFITLTYSEDCPAAILYECDAVKHNINYAHKEALSPLVLNKSHLQKFFKRLRKNTNIKFQYFACGEYGTKYGRPHYHAIIWSNDKLTENDIKNAWSLNDVPIGIIDFQDLIEDSQNITHSFKYVCKYLQKRDFDFSTIPTFRYHKQNMINNYLGVNPDFNFYNIYNDLYFYEDCPNDYELYEEFVTKDDFDKRYIQQGMRKYQAMYSPFFCCSKKPAIGFQYFAENKDRFSRQNFIIPELSGKNIFPSYYIRKTKEYLCPYKTISTENGKPNTYSNIPNVAALLVDLQNCIDFNEAFCVFGKTYEYKCGVSGSETYIEFISDKSPDPLYLPKKYFDFYDSKNHFYYSLAPDFKYNVTDSKKNLIYTLTIEEVIQEIYSTYCSLLHSFIKPMNDISQQKRKSKNEDIINQFGDFESYKKAKALARTNLMNIIKENQSKYKSKKILF